MYPPIFAATMAVTTSTATSPFDMSNAANSPDSVNIAASLEAAYAPTDAIQITLILPLFLPAKQLIPLL